MIIVPAIDLLNGKCVRLTKGDYGQQKNYSDNPLEVAQLYESKGATHLHVVDLEGARKGSVHHWQEIESIAKNTHLHVDVGGGIQTIDEFRRLMDIGVKQINLGSLAVKNPFLVGEWMNIYGPDRIIISADSRNEQVATSGWLEQTSIHLLTFIENYYNKGSIYFTCTDIETDGMLSGPNTNLYKRIIARFPEIKLFASGGIRSIEDLRGLRVAGLTGAVVGKAIYEGLIDLDKLWKE